MTEKYIIGRSYYQVLGFAALLQDAEGNLSVIHSDQIDSANMQIVLQDRVYFESSDGTISDVRFSTKRYTFTAEGSSFEFTRGTTLEEAEQIVMDQKERLGVKRNLLEDKGGNK